jgi:hypothetical protein
MAGSAKQEQKASRRRRLSAALRENLKRRKAQARERNAAGGLEQTAADVAAEPHDSAGIVPDKRSG